jgi:hypothetical protein
MLTGSDVFCVVLQRVLHTLCAPPKALYCNISVTVCTRDLGSSEIVAIFGRIIRHYLTRVSRIFGTNLLYNKVQYKAWRPSGCDCSLGSPAS